MHRESGVEKIVIAGERRGSDAAFVGVKTGSGDESSELAESSMLRASIDGEMTASTGVVVAVGVLPTASAMGVTWEGGVDGMEYISPPFIFLLRRSE